MKKLIQFTAVSLLLIFTGFSQIKASEKPLVQLAILLDTSGSMDGLIEQAKSQLWKIVNELALSHRDGESIELNVALYEYGNDGLSPDNGYIRMICPLTNDLDKISEELFKLVTNGGSEYCGHVIQTAVNDLKWSMDNRNLKIIFIAGNEPFTQGSVDYKESCKAAIQKGIIVNTIFCGNYEEGIQTYWKDGADLADGRYMNIDQNEQIVHIDAPQDDELIKLGQELNGTYIAYGLAGVEKKELQAEQDANSMSLSPESMVQRAVTKAGNQYNNASWDLVDAEEEGVIDISKIDEKNLPEEMQKMTADERVKYVEQMRNKREEIQNKINELNEDRRQYVAQKMLEMPDNTLDAVLIKAVREQAGTKNYEFDK